MSDVVSQILQLALGRSLGLSWREEQQARYLGYNGNVVLLRSLHAKHVIIPESKEKLYVVMLRGNSMNDNDGNLRRP